MSVEALVAEYLEIQKTIDLLESNARVLKDQIQEQLPVTPDVREWTFGNAKLALVKGRRVEKVDVKKVKTGLVLAGVDTDLLKSVFDRATTVSEGVPHLRISALGAAEEEEVENG